MEQSVPVKIDQLQLAIQREAPDSVLQRLASRISPWRHYQPSMERDDAVDLLCSDPYVVEVFLDWARQPPRTLELDEERQRLIPVLEPYGGFGYQLDHQLSSIQLASLQRSQAPVVINFYQDAYANLHIYKMIKIIPYSSICVRHLVLAGWEHLPVVFRDWKENLGGFPELPNLEILEIDGCVNRNIVQSFIDLIKHFPKLHTVKADLCASEDEYAQLIQIPNLLYLDCKLYADQLLNVRKKLMDASSMDASSMEISFPHRMIGFRSMHIEHVSTLGLMFPRLVELSVEVLDVNLEQSVENLFIEMRDYFRGLRHARVVRVTPPTNIRWNYASEDDWEFRFTRIQP